MNRTSYRPSAPLPHSVGVYRASNLPSYRAIYALFGALVVLAALFTVYLLLTAGDRPWPGR